MRRILTVAALGLLVCGAAQAQHRGNHGGVMVLLPIRVVIMEEAG
jgi:hypothetical protein